MLPGNGYYHKNTTFCIQLCSDVSPVFLFGEIATGTDVVPVGQRFLVWFKQSLLKLKQILCSTGWTGRRFLASSSFVWSPKSLDCVSPGETQLLKRKVNRSRDSNPQPAGSQYYNYSLTAVREILKFVKIPR